MAELNLKPNTFYRRVKERESKSTDSLLDAAKKLGKEIVNTGEELTQAAGKLAADYDIASITDTVKKNLTAAGKVFSSRMDSLSKDFQDAMQRTEKKAEEKKPETPAAPSEPAPTAAPEEPTPQPDADDPQNPEYL